MYNRMNQIQRHLAANWLQERVYNVYNSLLSFRLTIWWWELRSRWPSFQYRPEDAFGYLDLSRYSEWTHKMVDFGRLMLAVSQIFTNIINSFRLITNWAIHIEPDECKGIVSSFLGFYGCIKRIGLFCIVYFILRKP